MKNYLTGVCSLLLAFSATAQELNEGDRQALLDRLTEMKEGAENRAKERAGNALQAFQQASASDERAYEFYLKCVQKVRFIDEKRKENEFRQWKRRHDDVQDSKAFRCAIRHQLAWLSLTLQHENAASGSRAAMALSASELVDRVLQDAKLLRESFGQMNRRGNIRGYQLLGQNAFDSIFARAYSVKAPEPKWPTSPLDLKGVYREVVLPPFVEAKDVERVKGIWEKWMRQEAIVAEMKGNEPETGGRSADFDEFMLERRPQMVWELHKEIFSMGEEKSAALAMLEHLQNYQGHERETEWTAEFVALLQPEQEGSSPTVSAD